MELFDVYVTQTDEYKGTFCRSCLEHIEADNDHIDLTIVDGTEAGCDACEAMAEGYGRWMTKAEIEAEQAAMQAAR